MTPASSLLTITGRMLRQLQIGEREAARGYITSDPWSLASGWQFLTRAKALRPRETIRFMIGQKITEVGGLAKISQLPFLACRVYG